MLYPFEFKEHLMTTWKTEKFIAFGSLIYTQSRTIGRDELILQDVDLDLLYCVQCGDTYTEFDAVKAVGEVEVTCPNRHVGVIHMLNDQDENSPLSSD
jgi:hypothetical protein